MGFKFSKGPISIQEIKESRLLSLRDIQKWEEEFLVRSRGKNYFTEREFVETYRQTFTSGDAKTFARNVFRVMDLDGNGSIDLREFVLGMSSLTGDDVNKKIEWAFRVYDVNGDGVISPKEFKKIVRAIFKMHGRGVSSKEHIDRLCSDLMRSMDADRDGTITLQEFREGCRKHKFLLNALKV
ncbi:hypothetical protein SNE40_004893 [Patella caerulea]|uniref:EF-hand domain-containing protein n=1 Tax=Patella caerulea TaxID=87958 RepID=A0AAN8Q1G8_PATCE